MRRRYLRVGVLTGADALPGRVGDLPGRVGALPDQAGLSGRASVTELAALLADGGHHVRTTSDPAAMADRDLIVLAVVAREAPNTGRASVPAAAPKLRRANLPDASHSITNLPAASFENANLPAASFANAPATAVARAAARLRPHVRAGQIVVHTSLAADLTPLDDLETAGALVGAVCRLDDSRWAIDAPDERALAVLDVLVTENLGRACRLTPKQRLPLADAVARRDALAADLAQANRLVASLLADAIHPSQEKP